MEMAVRTAQTPGSVSWIGWSANFCATARTSSGVTLGGVGVATEQDASSLAAVLGVTTRSAHGSGAISRARGGARLPLPGRAPWRGGGTAEREADGRELAGGEEWKRLVDGATLTHGHGARRVLSPAVVRGLWSSWRARVRAFAGAGV